VLAGGEGTAAVVDAGTPEDVENAAVVEAGTTDDVDAADVD